ncbi:YbaB/EbfC family nucleoid-associated protein [Nocardia anaemiae]|uniref:YbaB/EbfC family nucleoid-associated protein n=1 Tax=Nocardia anaemiae TaxID=263910 RepID=UPI0007A37F7E|nr:YbaB/EbfC family nucleoid-associated protein [Nocardia anaemiae]
MDRWEREGLRSANFGIRNQVENILDALGEQRAHRAELQRKLDTARCEATSADGLVQVTVDNSGVLIDVRFTKDAAHSTAEQLGRSVTEAGREAARRMREQTTQILAPVATAVHAMPDLPDLVLGASSLRQPEEAETHGYSQNREGGARPK